MKSFIFIAFLFLSLSAFGATTNKIVTVKAAGGDYATLSAAEAGEQGNFIDWGRQLTIECYALTDTTAVTVDGSTCDASNYIEIKGAGTGRHAGVFDTGKYLLDISGTALNLSDDCCRVDGIQIRVTRNSSGARYGINTQGATGVVYNVNCILVGVISSTAGGIIGIRHNGGGTSGLCAWNNLFVNWTGGAGGNIGMQGQDFKTLSKILNNTFVACDTALVRTAGTANITNCLFSGCTADASGTIVDAYCATSNDNTKGLTAAGTGHRFSQTFTFAGAGNYHLASNDGGARNYGLDLSATFTTDVDGETRPTGAGTWDIGFDEYLAAGGTAPKPTYLLKGLLR